MNRGGQERFSYFIEWEFLLFKQKNATALQGHQRRYRCSAGSATNDDNVKIKRGFVATMRLQDRISPFALFVQASR